MKNIDVKSISDISQKLKKEFDKISINNDSEKLFNQILNSMSQSYWLMDGEKKCMCIGAKFIPELSYENLSAKLLYFNYIVITFINFSKCSINYLNSVKNGKIQSSKLMVKKLEVLRDLATNILKSYGFSGDLEGAIDEINPKCEEYVRKKTLKEMVDEYNSNIKGLLNSVNKTTK